MKKLMKFMLAAVLVSTAAMSCSNDDPNSEEVGPVNPPTEADYTSVPETTEGVTITAHTTSKGFEFTTKMGIDIPTYRLDVMPYARFENDFMDARNNAKKEGRELTEREFIIAKLFGSISAGNAGYAMNAPFDGNWFDSKFKQAEFIPGLDYVILTCGALQEDGTGVGEVNKLVVPMYKPTPVGDPQVAITLRSDYTGVEFSFAMNDDCSGYYQLIFPKEEADAVLAEFGADGPRKLRDICCTFMQGPMRENWEPQYIKFPYNVVPGFEVSAITVALDKNGVPANTYNRKDIALKSEKKPAAEYNFKVTLLSALMIVTEWDIDPGHNGHTSTAYHRVVDEAYYESMRSSMTEFEIQVQLADGGFMHNSVGGFIDVDYFFQPNTNYVLISTAMNKGNEFTPIRVYPIKTKPLILDQQEQSLAQIKAEFTDIAKTSVAINLTIPAGTTGYFENAVEKGYKIGGVDVTDPETPYETIVNLLIFNEDFFTLRAPYTTNDGSALNALDPDKEYCYFLVAEDSLGRMGPLIRKTFTTKNNLGGPNPKVDITGKVKQESDGSFSWIVRFTVNEDVTNMLYAVYEDETPAGSTEAEQMTFWTEKVLGIDGDGKGMPSVNSISIDTKVTKLSKKMAVAFPYGANEKPGAVVFLKFDPALITSDMLSVRPLRMNAPASQFKNVGRTR